MWKDLPQNVPRIPRIQVPAAAADNSLLKVRGLVPTGKGFPSFFGGVGTLCPVCVRGRCCLTCMHDC